MALKSAITDNEDAPSQRLGSATLRPAVRRAL
jgi:hypothetical protein